MVSIISREADSIYIYKGSACPDQSDLLPRLYDNEDLREAYEQGASRRVTNEEIKAAVDYVGKSIILPGRLLETIIRDAFNAARRKATEDESFR